jgi:uncharacterized membrane-anchored protein
VLEQEEGHAEQGGLIPLPLLGKVFPLSSGEGCPACDGFEVEELGSGKYLSRMSLFCFSSSIFILAYRTVRSLSLSLICESRRTILVWAALSSFCKSSIE